MAEVMREVIETAELEGVAKLHPGARKVTIDEANGVGYVFLGRSRRAITVSDEAFEALVKALPTTAGDGATPEGGQAQGAASLDPAAPDSAALKVKRGKSGKAGE